MTEIQQSQPQKSEKPIWKRWWFWVIIVWLFIVVIIPEDDEAREKRLADSRAREEARAEQRLAEEAERAAIEEIKAAERLAKESEKIAAEETETAKRLAEEAERVAIEKAEIAKRLAKEKELIMEIADKFCVSRGEGKNPYTDLNDTATWLEEGKAIQIANTRINPSRASCERIAEVCLKSKANWSEEECKNIADRRIWVGMTKEQLTISWGIPRRENDTVGVWGIKSQWIYGDFGPYVYLEGETRKDKVVTGWQSAR